tara:strand:+ start:18471 stop:18899 length:429 start_codon:yes stop_codon:yes gene_type:complete
LRHFTNLPFSESVHFLAPDFCHSSNALHPPWFLRFIRCPAPPSGGWLIKPLGQRAGKCHSFATNNKKNHSRIYCDQQKGIDMEAAVKFESHEEVVSFDQQGNVVVNKESQMSKKLMARRAIEAHLERKRLEKDLDDYYFDEM